jgi:molecular chaperone DnaK
LKQAKDSNNIDELKQKIESLSKASHKLAEVMYQQSAAQGGQDGPGAPGADAGASPQDDEDVVDADFEEVKKDK